MSLDSVLDSADEVRRKKIDKTFHRTITSDELRKTAEAFGFDLEIDFDTEIASLWRKGSDEGGWALYRGHWTSVQPWLHGYAICALYLGHL
jgi:hypothetical protein